MTDVVHAREASIAAETRVESLFNYALDQLHALNSKLLELHDAIKAAQPVEDGSICLELYSCGPGCSGCPHPRWVKYRWTLATNTRPSMVYGVNLDKMKQDPVLALSRKKPHYKTTATLIRETKAILAKRSTLLASISRMRNTLKPKTSGNV